MGQSHLLAVIMKIHGLDSEHRLIIKALFVAPLPEKLDNGHLISLLQEVLKNKKKLKTKGEWARFRRVELMSPGLLKRLLIERTHHRKLSHLTTGFSYR